MIHTLERALHKLLTEACDRGAGQIDLLLLISIFEQRQAMIGRRPSLPIGQSYGLLVPSSDVVVPEMGRNARRWRADTYLRDYETRTKQEFAELPAVHVHFNFEDEGGSFVYYKKLRPYYFNDGLHDLRPVFKRLKTVAFLRKRVVVLDEMAERLKRAETTLDGWKAGLASEIAAEIGLIESFVPRLERGSESKLSNHSFGLAIDIDSATNPYVANPEVVRVIAEVTGFRLDQAMLALQDQDESAVDQAAQTYVRLQEASERLKKWLQEWIPKFKQRDVAPSGLMTPASQSTSQRSWKPGDNITTNEKRTSNPGDKSEVERVRHLRNIGLVHSLYVALGKRDDVLQRWMERGIHTLPFYLVIALVMAGLRWGGMYESKKDGMHFELLDDDNQILKRKRKGRLSDVIANM